MNGIPGGLRTDQQPPMAIPLRHFVLALGFLVAGVGGGVVMTVATLPGLSGLAHLHLLLVGWVGVTIMGAMTQFVPVWSGATIHSRRLAVAQLWLLVAGLVGFAAALLAGALAWLPVGGALMLAGIWTFVYNVGRTLSRARPFDFTERHFALALASFGLVAPLGLALAIDFTTPVFDSIGVTRAGIHLSHATLALFGALLATVVGALFQLTKMFTQADPDRLDEGLLALEQVCFPAGLAALALGRGLAIDPLARVGAVGLAVGLLAFAVVVGRLLAGATVERSPMLARYWVVVAALFAWIALAGPTWWADPLAFESLFGHPGARNLLLFGVFGFVVIGSLYHIVPFIIWIEHYSDRLGFEQVPMIDDLYDDRLERADFWTTLGGFGGLAVAPLAGLPAAAITASSVLAAVGVALFVANMLLTIHRHGPDGIAGVLASRLGSSDDSSATSPGEPDVGVSAEQ
ncbi:hypothetical protein [Natrinema salsiterrestre]|uniref:Uncharacterized protein n=1 Tax=Natrinema salsiterrestre TaxID=2950540 RepID=A0A9Q4KYQ8_9EURY|nr:hypothetical protein [Natrinema salsiterrestre]MDF9746500.1 hypothetical protein [Natrinema salsiterrestre]